MRIAVGQLWQETNTLNPWPTGREDFERFGVLRGPELVSQMARTNELGGFIQSLAGWPERPEVVGLVRLPAWPAGVVTAEAFDWLRSEMLDALEKAGPLDGVLLALHGSMVADTHPDVEGEILTAVRERIGGAIPLVATLDLHANVTLQMALAADALVLYHSVPHIDVYETGERGAGLLRRILIEGAQPLTAFQKVPVVVPPVRANTQADSGVSVDFKRRLQELERTPGVLAAGLATAQPWLDIPNLGSCILVTTDNQPELARQACIELADQLWQRREEYLTDLLSPEEAVRRARKVEDGLVVLSDPADATTSGAPGDSVWILKELLRHEWSRPVLATVVAPPIVAEAERAGAGATLEVTLGGVLDHRFGTTISLGVTVERLFRARFVLSGHLGKNMPIDMGPSAVLRHDAVRVIVTSWSGPHFAPELFQVAGLDPFAAHVLVAKSPAGFRAAYASRALAMYSVRAPGCAPEDFWNYPYANIPHPLWPWDKMGGWRAQPVLLHPRGAR
jgi:microcystin degradation protein MlrC